MRIPAVGLCLRLDEDDIFYLNRLPGAIIETGKAHVTQGFPAPDRLAILHAYLSRQANLFAYAAAYALFIGIEVIDAACPLRECKPGYSQLFHKGIQHRMRTEADSFISPLLTANVFFSLLLRQRNQAAQVPRLPRPLSPPGKEPYNSHAWTRYCPCSEQDGR